MLGVRSPCGMSSTEYTMAPGLTQGALDVMVEQDVAIRSLAATAALEVAGGMEQGLESFLAAQRDGPFQRRPQDVDQATPELMQATEAEVSGSDVALWNRGAVVAADGGAEAHVDVSGSAYEADFSWGQPSQRGLIERRAFVANSQACCLTRTSNGAVEGAPRQLSPHAAEKTSGTSVPRPEETTERVGSQQDTNGLHPLQADWDNVSL